MNKFKKGDRVMIKPSLNRTLMCNPDVEPKIRDKVGVIIEVRKWSDSYKYDIDFTKGNDNITLSEVNFIATHYTVIEKELIFANNTIKKL